MTLIQSCPPDAAEASETPCDDLLMPGREPVTWLRRVDRWWQVLRHYRTGQIARRLLSRGQSWLANTFHYRARLPDPGALDSHHHEMFQSLFDARRSLVESADVPAKARDLLDGRFRFLNETRIISATDDWQQPDQRAGTRLWHFHFHYQEYLLDLLASAEQESDACYVERAWQLVETWMANYAHESRPAQSDAWHPFCISRRIPVWIMLFARDPAKCFDPDAFLRGLYQQAWYLRCNLEWDLRGNHLLENLRALYLAGLFFREPSGQAWCDDAVRLLTRELTEQILPTGEHFEQTPMYHASMLQLLIEMSVASRSTHADFARTCRHYIGSMTQFLERSRHPDGEIPLLGDSCFGAAPPTGRLVRLANEVAGDDSSAERKPSDEPSTIESRDSAETFPDYWTFRDQSHFLIFDAGEVGASFLPAHAHCDLLNFEASIAGRRMIVDSGVFNYEDDEMRAYCRSTVAHNVLLIDEREQCDVWSRFRMGYRGAIVDRRCGVDGEFSWAAASHNAYRRIGVPVVRRWFACRADGPWFCVDSAQGAGRRRLTNLLHFHPDCTLRVTGPREVEIARNDLIAKLRMLTPGELAIKHGWYCPEFGVRHSAPVVVWTSVETLPSVCGWQLSWQPETAAAELSLQENSWRLNWHDGARLHELQPNTAGHD